MATITPVLLCGDVGSRLWPISRHGGPKQYLNLISETSMLQQTLARIESLAQTSPIIVCNEAHRFLVAEQVRQLGLTSPTFILEPEGKNTAPAIALAALLPSASDPEVALLVLPAVHYVSKPAALIDAVGKAGSASTQGKLVTFGPVPSRPETGFGYIRRGEALAIDVSVLEQFVEQPDQPTAEGYIASRNYVWNSGMFTFTAAQFLASLAQFQPEMAQVCERAMEQTERDMDFICPNAEVFATCPSDSIDYAVLEHTPEGAVVSLDCDWSDIGA